MMRDGSEELQKLYEEEREDGITIINTNSMTQQLNFYLNKYSSLAHQSNVPSNLQVIENPQIEEKEEKESKFNETIDDILSLPEKYKRKTNRVYKLRNSGVMTSKESLSLFKEHGQKLKEVDDEKERKKNEREGKRLLKEQILKIKKEKDDESKVVKKRGRPKKS